MDVAGIRLPPTSLAPLRTKKRCYSVSVSSLSPSADSPPHSPVFSVEAGSQQSSAASSAASSSLDIGWDVESRSSSTSSSSSCPDGYSPVLQNRHAALGRLDRPHSPPEPVRRRAIIPPTSNSAVAVAVARASRPPSPLSGRDLASLPPALRQNRRRTIRPGPAACPRPPPALVRQSDRKLSFVDSLVGKLGRFQSPIELTPWAGWSSSSSSSSTRD